MRVTKKLSLYAFIRLSIFISVRFRVGSVTKPSHGTASSEAKEPKVGKNSRGGSAPTTMSAYGRPSALGDVTDYSRAYPLRLDAPGPVARARSQPAARSSSRPALHLTAASRLTTGNIAGASPLDKATLYHTMAIQAALKTVFLEILGQTMTGTAMPSQTLGHC